MSCEPSEDQIWATVKLLKNRRVLGIDKITAELLKLGKETAVQWLTQVHVHVPASLRQSETVPVDLVKQMTIPLHKKGAHDHCDKLRSIAMLSVSGKVFCSVTQRKLALRGY